MRSARPLKGLRSRLAGSAATSKSNLSYRKGPSSTKTVENGDVAQIGGSEDRLRELAHAYLQDCDG